MIVIIIYYFTTMFPFFFSIIYLFIFGCAGSSFLRGLSLVVVSGGYSSCGAWAFHCSGFSCCAAQALESAGFSSCDSHKGSVVVVHGLHWSMAGGIFLDQGTNPSVLHRQADSIPLSHQGSPESFYFVLKYLWNVIFVWTNVKTFH